MSDVQRNERGFRTWPAFDARWHGKIYVDESSIAFEGPCCWVGALVGYAEPAKPPNLHLNLDDAKNLRDRLDAFIKAAEANELCEKVEETVKGTGEDEGSNG